VRNHHDGNGAQGERSDDIDIDKSTDLSLNWTNSWRGLPGGSKLSRKKLPSGMTDSSSFSKGRSGLGGDDGALRGSGRRGCGGQGDEDGLKGLRGGC
jgi:hypothetical protein